VVRVAEALEVVVDLVADVVGHGLADGLAEVLLAKLCGATPDREDDDGERAKNHELFVAVEPCELAGCVFLRVQAEVDRVAHEQRAHHHEDGRGHHRDPRQRELLLIGLQVWNKAQKPAQKPTPPIEQAYHTLTRT
jgi:hypothetical protein